MNHQEVAAISNAYDLLRTITNACLTDDEQANWNEAESILRELLKSDGVTFTKTNRIVRPIAVYPSGVKGCQVCERGRSTLEDGDLFSGNWPGLPVVCREHLPVVETMWFKRRAE